MPGAMAPGTPVRLVATITHGDAGRVRSYELPAEVWRRGLGPGREGQAAKPALRAPATWMTRSAW